MVKYIYIPEKYEDLLATAINTWLTNLRAWTCIKGEYESTDLLDESVSKVVNRNVLLETQKIVRGYEFKGKRYKLAGYCLEGDLEKYALDFYVQLSNLSDVVIYESAADYRDFISQLTFIMIEIV